jgi:hypothetical protein
VRRLALLLLPLLLIVAGCGGAPRSSPRVTQPATLTFSEPAGPACYTRNPPAMGECVAEHFGLRIPTVSSPGAVNRGECADISHWQGAYPDLSGLRCVIIQSNYGLTPAPDLYSQIADANTHHIPWGAYVFMEGDGGDAEAQLAVQLTNGRGRTLGVEADAEVGAAYPHACELIREVFALHMHIAQLFAAPGMWPGGRCEGWLWPSEWGVSAAYPFAGYPSSAIKLWQDCGTCSRFDRDVDEGLIALSKPAKPKPLPPSTRKHLIALWERERAGVLHEYHKAGCKAWSMGPKCSAWRRREHALFLAVRHLEG